MERRPHYIEPKFRSPLRRWAREIMLAALLTAVAAIFIASALLRSDDTGREPSAFETARTPSK
jgi:hypothetical protein